MRVEKSLNFNVSHKVDYLCILLLDMSAICYYIL